MSDAEQSRALEADEEDEASSLTPNLETGLSRRHLGWETAAVLALVLLPAWFNSVAWLVWGDADSLACNALRKVMRSAQICLIVCYLISRSGERWSDFGIARPRWLLDPSLAMGVWMCNVVFNLAMLRLSAHLLGPDQFEALTRFSDHSREVAHTSCEHALLLASLASSSFAQELVMRAYLLRRFEQWFSSTWLSVLFTTVLFAGGHAYQGAGGVFHTFIAGLTYAGAFCFFRRLWPVAIAHTIWDWAATFGG